MIDYDSLIGVALDFAELHENTLISVTADHETGGFDLASSEKLNSNGEEVDDYNLIKPSFSTNGHSETLIPVFTFGLGSKNFSGVY